MTLSWYAGLMTGTVLDGQIDVSLLRTDGEQIAEFGPFDLVPYAPEVNALYSKRWARPEIGTLMDPNQLSSPRQSVH